MIWSSFAIEFRLLFLSRLQGRAVRALAFSASACGASKGLLAFTVQWFRLQPTTASPVTRGVRTIGCVPRTGLAYWGIRKTNIESTTPNE